MMLSFLVDYLSWIATGVFVLSYFCSSHRPACLQMAGAVLWIAYGTIISAPPVIVVNMLVFMAAASSTVRMRRVQDRKLSTPG